MRTAFLAAAVLFAGCQPDLGECDAEAANEIVYTADGTPALAGQALINQSCGGGGFCHASGIAAGARYGAPVGLELDLTIAATSDQAAFGETARLGESQRTAYGERHAIWTQVDSGRMPPVGADAESVLAQADRYDRVADDGVTFTPLPGLDTDEGRAILRGWLACGTPVIERTTPHPPEVVTPVGFVARSCDRRCVDPTWPALHAEILAPSCATADCHDAEDPEAELDLSGGDLDALRDRLVEQTGSGVSCGSREPFSEMPMIAPGDPEGSLLYVKVSPRASTERCGARMPLGRNPLSEQALCALEAWIEAGACATSTEAPCADLLPALRARCNVTADGGGCEMPDTCPNQLETSRM